MPWALAVRWSWLRGLRARQAGQADEALVCLRRCEQFLKWGKKQRRRVQSRGGSGVRQGAKEGTQDREEEEGGEDEAVVLLPHCVVHPRVDVQVRTGMLRSVTLQGSFFLGEGLLEL